MYTRRVAAAGTIDLLHEMNIKEAAQNAGVGEVIGYCGDRPGAQDGSGVAGPDLAYDVTSRAELSVPSFNLFPGTDLMAVIHSYYPHRAPCYLP